MDWEDLHRELDLWSENNRVATFWWRDDDASEPVPALVRLLSLADRFDIHVALATVPEWTTVQLAQELEVRPRPTILQHGFGHRNHAAPGQRAVECGGERLVSQVLDELRTGRKQLELLFGSRFLPILVPPWNHIAGSVLAHLPDLRYEGLSIFRTCLHHEPISGLPMMNTHVDVLTWRGRIQFAGRKKVLRELIDHLQARRTGVVDPDEPVGLLTHHRDHDGAAWEFVEDLLRVTSRHPAARWRSIEQAFGSRFRTIASSEGCAS